MTRLTLDISMSLDGFVAGPNRTLEEPLGKDAGLLDEIQIHIAPVLLVDGVRLFDQLNPEPPALQCTRVIASASVTHLRFRVSRAGTNRVPLASTCSARRI